MKVRKASLSSSSFVIFGLFAINGPGTSYDLVQWVDESVGFFWSFPRSQLYAEPDRLSRLGYLSEQREDAGRRRRVYALTESGRSALQLWLRPPTREQPELRDPGLLKLFFMSVATANDLAALADEQVATHRSRLDEYERLERDNSGDPHAAFPMATLQLGLMHERVALEFWKRIKDDPPGTAR